MVDSTAFMLCAANEQYTTTGVFTTQLLSTTGVIVRKARDKTRVQL
jgi:hypothetical protein